MKTLLLFFVSFFICVNCVHQKGPTPQCWFSKKYIDSIDKKDTSGIKNTIIPIEGFEEEHDTLYILTYMGEITPLQYKKVSVNGKEMMQILDFEYCLNLKYLSEDLVDRYSKAEFYLNRLRDTMELTIIEGDKKETQYFINNYKSKRFTSLWDTKDYLLKMAEQ